MYLSYRDSISRAGSGFYQQLVRYRRGIASISLIGAPMSGAPSYFIGIALGSLTAGIPHFIGADRPYEG